MAKKRRRRKGRKIFKKKAGAKRAAHGRKVYKVKGGYRIGKRK